MVSIHLDQAVTQDLLCLRLSTTQALMPALAKQAVLLPVSDSVLTGGVSLNDLKACFPYSGTLYFKVALNGNSNPGSAALSINKEVQNSSTGTGFASSVNATQGNNLNYRITVTNHGQITANNVSVTDTGAFGISFTG